MVFWVEVGVRGSICCGVAEATILCRASTALVL